MSTGHAPARRAFFVVCAIALCSLVLAGDVDPPAGPVGDSGPSLGDVLGAIASPGAGTSVMLRELTTPPAFTTVSSTDGVLQRVVMTNASTTNTLVVHLRDATGVLAQCVVDGVETKSLALGIAYTAPLEASVSGQSGLTSVSVVVQELD